MYGHKLFFRYAAGLDPMTGEPLPRDNKKPNYRAEPNKISRKTDSQTIREPSGIQFLKGKLANLILFRRNLKNTP